MTTAGHYAGHAGAFVTPDWNPLDHPRKEDGQFVKKGTGTYLYGKVLKGVYKTPKDVVAKPLAYTLEPGDVAYETPKGNLLIWRAAKQDWELRNPVLPGKVTKGIGTGGIKSSVVTAAQNGELHVIEASPAVEIPATSLAMAAKKEAALEAEHDAKNPKKTVTQKVGLEPSAPPPIGSTVVVTGDVFADGQPKLGTITEHQGSSVMVKTDVGNDIGPLYSYEYTVTVEGPPHVKADWNPEQWTPVHVTPSNGDAPYDGTIDGKTMIDGKPAFHIYTNGSLKWAFTTEVTPWAGTPGEEPLAPWEAELLGQPAPVPPTTQDALGPYVAPETQKAFVGEDVQVTATNGPDPYWVGTVMALPDAKGYWSIKNKHGLTTKVHDNLVKPNHILIHEDDVTITQWADAVVQPNEFNIGDTVDVFPEKGNPYTGTVQGYLESTNDYIIQMFNSLVVNYVHADVVKPHVEIKHMYDVTATSKPAVLAESKLHTEKRTIATNWGTTIDVPANSASWISKAKAYVLDGDTGEYTLYTKSGSKSGKLLDITSVDGGVAAAKKALDAAVQADIKKHNKAYLWWNEGSLEYEEVQAAHSLPKQIQKVAHGFCFNHPVSYLLVPLDNGDVVYQHKASKDSFVVLHSNGSGTFIGKNGKQMKASDKTLEVIPTNYEVYWAMPGSAPPPPSTVSTQASKSKPKGKPSVIPQEPMTPVSAAKAAKAPKPGAVKSKTGEPTKYVIDGGATVIVPTNYTLFKVDPNHASIVATGNKCEYVLQPPSNLDTWYGILADGTTFEIPSNVIQATWGSPSLAKGKTVKAEKPTPVPTPDVVWPVKTKAYWKNKWDAWNLPGDSDVAKALLEQIYTAMGNTSNGYGGWYGSTPLADRVDALTKPETRAAVLKAWSTFENSTDYYNALPQGEKARFAKTRNNFLLMLRSLDFLTALDSGEIDTNDPQAKAEYGDIVAKMSELKFTYMNENHAKAWYQVISQKWADVKFKQGLTGLGFDPDTASKQELDDYCAKHGFPDSIYLTQDQVHQWVMNDLGSPNHSNQKPSLEKQAKWAHAADKAAAFIQKYSDGAPQPAGPTAEEIAQQAANDAAYKEMPVTVTLDDGRVFMYDRKNGVYIVIKGSEFVSTESPDSAEMQWDPDHAVFSTAKVGDAPGPIDYSALIAPGKTFYDLDLTPVVAAMGFSEQDLSDVDWDEKKRIVLAQLSGNIIAVDALDAANFGTAPWYTPSGEKRWQMFADNMINTEFAPFLFTPQGNTYDIAISLDAAERLHALVDLTPFLDNFTNGNPKAWEDANKAERNAAAQTYLMYVSKAMVKVQQDGVWHKPGALTTGVLGPDIDTLKPANTSDAAWTVVKALLTVPVNSPEFTELVGPQIAGMTPQQTGNAVHGVEPSGFMSGQTAQYLPENVQKALLWLKDQNDTNAWQGFWTIVKSGAFYGNNELYVPESGPYKDVPLLVPPGWSVYHVSNDTRALFVPNDWEATGAGGYWVRIDNAGGGVQFQSIPNYSLKDQIDNGYLATTGSKPLTQQDAEMSLGPDIASQWDWVQAHEAVPWNDQPEFTAMGSPGEAAYRFHEFTVINDHEHEWPNIEGAIATMPDSLKWVVAYASEMKQPKILALVDWKLSKGHYAPLFILGNDKGSKPYAKYLLSGQIGYKDVQGWSHEAQQAYANDYAIPATAVAISQHISGKKKEGFKPPSKIKDVKTITLTEITGGHGLGGAHSKHMYADQYGQKWMAKGYPNDNQPEARVDTEHVANVIGRLFGFNQPQTTVMDLQSITSGPNNEAYKYAYVQHLADALPDGFAGITPKDLNDEQLSQAMEEHVLDWMISNHDTYDGNLMLSPDGQSVIGIDKGQAFRFFGDDKLAVGYKPSTNPYPVWYDQFYYGVINHSVNKERADMVTKRVLRRAWELQKRYDEQFEDLLHQAFGKRKAWSKKYPNEDALVAGVMERKTHLFDDFVTLYKDVYKQAGYEFDFDLDALRVEKVGDAHVTTSKEFTDDIAKSHVHGVSLMLASKDIEDAHVLFFTTQAQDGSTSLHGEAKVLKKGDAEITKWLEAQGYTSNLSSVPTTKAPKKKTPQIPGTDHTGLPMLDQAFSTVASYATTVSHHADNGEYNVNTIANGEALLAKLTAERDKAHSWLTKNPTGLLTVEGTTLGTHEQQMAWLGTIDYYIMALEHIKEAHTQKVKIKALYPDEVPYAQKMYSPSPNLNTTGTWKPDIIIKPKDPDNHEMKFTTDDGGYFIVDALGGDNPRQVDKSEWDAFPPDGDPGSWEQVYDARVVPGYEPPPDVKSWTYHNATNGQDYTYTQNSNGDWAIPAYLQAPAVSDADMQEMVKGDPKAWKEYVPEAEKKAAAEAAKGQHQWTFVPKQQAANQPSLTYVLKIGSTKEAVYTQGADGKFTTPDAPDTSWTKEQMDDSVANSPENWTISNGQALTEPTWVHVGADGVKTTYTWDADQNLWMPDNNYSGLSPYDLSTQITSDTAAWSNHDPAKHYWVHTADNGQMSVWTEQPSGKFTSGDAYLSAHEIAMLQKETQLGTWTEHTPGAAQPSTEPSVVWKQQDDGSWLSSLGVTYTNAEMDALTKDDSAGMWIEWTPDAAAPEGSGTPASWTYVDSISGTATLTQTYVEQPDGSWYDASTGETYVSTDDILSAIDNDPSKWSFTDASGFKETSTVVASGAKTITVTHKKSSGYTGTLGEDNILKEIGEQHTGFGGEEFDISFGNVLIQYQPWDYKYGVHKARKGSLRFSVKDWDGSGKEIDEIIDVLKQMNLDVSTADKQSLELFYWRHLYGVLQDRNSRNESPYKEVVAYISNAFTANPMMSQPGHEAEELKMLREAWALAYGADRIKEITDTEWYRPRFGRGRLEAPDTHTGHPYWYHPAGVKGLEAARKKGSALLYHSNHSGTDEIAILRSGVIIPTEERLRMLGNFSGGSPGADQGAGSSAFMFMRLLHGWSPNQGELFIAGPEVLMRTNNYSLSGDSCGEIDLRPNVSSFDMDSLHASTSTITGLSGPETQVKNGIAFSDLIGMRTDSSSKSKLLAYCAAHGITEINGVPVDQFFQVGTHDWKPDWDAALERFKQREGLVAS